MNPLSTQYLDQENLALVSEALNGSKDALDKLVRKHQPFIFNLAWKMCYVKDDAMDLTQEVLIKFVTKLSQFDGRSKFRTWLYRIVVNEFLQTKRRNGESKFSTFENHGNQLDSFPDEQPTAEEEIELSEMIHEVRFRCMSGMLMCLTREQRLIYLLGDTFGVDHNIGSEIFDISAANFRIKLHRARKDLYNFMSNKCGLVNKKNPCRCSKKAKAGKKMGILDEQSFIFNVGYKERLLHHAASIYDDAAETVDRKYTEFFRGHPAKDKFKAETIIDEILNNDEIMRYFNFN